MLERSGQRPPSGGHARCARSRQLFCTVRGRILQCALKGALTVIRRQKGWAGMIELAVVGYGYWGSKHVRVLTAIPGVAVTIVDSDPARLAAARRAFPTAR